jgi:hypothetical protein
MENIMYIRRHHCFFVLLVDETFEFLKLIENIKNEKNMKYLCIEHVRVTVYNSANVELYFSREELYVNINYNGNLFENLSLFIKDIKNKKTSIFEIPKCGQT